MPFKVTGYTRLETRYCIEVEIWNDTVGMPARLLIDPSEWKVYFNGSCCDVPRLCKIMDEVNKPCAEMTVEIEDATATTVKCAYFSLSESTVHSWVTGHPGSIRHKVTRETYGNEFTLTIEELFNVDGRGNGVYFGDGNTRVYLNGKGSWAWSDIFLEGNKVKKISWHWHYCATMDKYIKWLSEVWFVNTEAEKEETRAVPNPKYDINVLKARLDIKPEEFIPYDPSEFEFKPNNNKEETKMSKTIKEVWDSMTREQQDACCVLIGEAAKKNSSLDYEIKKKVAAMQACEYMIRVKGTDIRDIIFNGPATIILWRDGSKTVVKQQKGDKWDPEKAVAMAVMKKVFGTNETGSNYLEFVKPYIEKALEGHKGDGCDETAKNPADELIEMAQELIIDMTYGGATKAELVKAIKYSKELIDWLKAPAGGYVKTGSPTELLEKYGIAELRKKYQKG